MGGSQSVRPIEETVILHLKAVGKYFGGKGQYGVKKSEAMQVIRYVVNSTDTDEKPYRLLAEAFAASDISAEADDDDIAGEAGCRPFTCNLFCSLFVCSLV